MWSSGQVLLLVLALGSVRAQDVTIGFDPTTYNVTEGDGSVTLTVAVLSGSLDRDVVVNVSTVDGSATAGNDYTAINMTLTFMNGSATSQTITIDILDDDAAPVVEDSETFIVTLTTTETNVTIAPTSATVNIEEDDDTVTIGFNDIAYTVTEGGGASVSVSVLSGSLARNVVVTLQTMGGTATATADYTTVTRDLTFNADTSTQTVEIPTAGDTVLEMPESFSVSLSQMPVDTAVTLNPVNTTVTIQDNDTVTIGFNDTAYTVTEGGNASVSVSVLSGSLARDVVVTLQTVNGTTTDPADYTAVSRDLIFNAGTSTQTVEIPTAGDTVVEMPESFSVSLSQMPVDTAVTLNPASTTVTIQDNTTVTIGFNTVNYTVTEGADSVTVTVAVQGGSLARDVVVALSTMDDTAMAPGDYTAITNMQLTFNSAMMSQTVMITIADGDVVEGPETFTVNLTSSDTAVMLNPMTATVNIQEDSDTVMVGFESTSYVVSESAGSVSVCASLTGQLDRSVMVTFTTADGSATIADSDYTAVTMDRTFMSGTNSECVDITIRSDGMNEMTAETFYVMLSSNDSAVVLSSNVTTVTIVDPPAITTNPSAQSNVIPGMSAMFMVAANGSDLTYQWQRMGVNLTDGIKYSGTTTASLTVMDVEEADEGMFRCIVTNAVDSVPSMSAQLTVLDPPEISVQPDSRLEVDPGSSVMFSITASTDAGVLSYQWQRDDIDIGASSEVSGVDSSTLTINNVQEGNEGNYACIVTNAAGNTTSNAAELTVLDPPSITTHPQNVANAIPGSDVVFTVTATGMRLSYSWQQGNGTALPSDSRFDTSDEMLTIQNVMPSDVGSYRCVVTNAAGNDTSNAADLTLIGPPDITVPPQSVAVENGSDVDFTCTATGLGMLTFSWMTTASVTLPAQMETSNSTAMTATSTLSLTGVDTSYRGEYTCRVSNQRGSDISQANLTVIVIEDIMPDNVTATLGTNVVFVCSASGSEDISYSWTRTVVGTDGSLVDVGFNRDTRDRLDGVNSPMLTIRNVSVLDVEEGQDYMYTCFVNVSDTTVGYRTAILRTQTVNIIESPSSSNISEGEDFTLRCEAQNNPDAPGDLQFFWYHNGQGLVDGVRINIEFVEVNATTRVARSELEVMNARDEDSGTYMCRVTNRDLVDAIGVDSEITVLFAPVLDFPEGEDTVNRVLRKNVDITLTLRCTATAVPPPTFVEIWRNDGVLMTVQGIGSRSLSVTYQLQNLMLSDSGVYVCVANNSEGRTERNFTLQVQDLPGVVDNTTVVRMLVSLTSVQLTWDEPEDNNAQITSYNITYCPTATNGATSGLCVDQQPTIISVPTLEPTAVLDGLNPVRRYRVYIRAENDAGLGPQSQPYFFDSANAEDAQPENFTAVFVSETGVVLTWLLPDITMSENNVMFNFQYTRRGSGNTTTVTVSQQQQTTQGVTVAGLDSRAFYDFTVSAMYDTLNSTAVSVSQETQPNVLLNNPTPPAVNQDSITVSWPAPDGEEFVENYILEYTAVSRVGQSNGRKRRQAETLSRNITDLGTQRSAEVMGEDLQPFSDYTFRVFADFGNGLVAQIVAPFTTVSQQAASSEPVDLQVDISHVSLTLSWNSPQKPNGIIAQYNVCFSNVSTDCRPVPAQGNRNVHTRYGLTPGTMYDISVNAINRAGPGNLTTTRNTTTYGVFLPEIVTQSETDRGIYNLMIQLRTTYGPISHYKVVVVRIGDRSIDTRTYVPDNMLLPADQSETNYYAAAALPAFLTMVDARNTTFSVGDGQTSMLESESFENVRLNANQIYLFFIRAYSMEIPTTFNDSELSRGYISEPRSSLTSPPMPTTSPTRSFMQPAGVNPAAIIAPIAAIAALLLVVFIILLIVAILTRKPTTKRHRFDDGMLDGKRKAHAVELRRTRLFSPVLNVACPDVFTSAGQPTTLLCEASGTPAPEVSWTCDGKPLDKERCIQLADSSLFIQDTDLQDEGNYLVVATNSAGTAEQMVRVTVIRPVPPEPDTMHLPIPVGDFTERIALLRLNDDEGLEDEYTDVDLDWNFTSYASKLNINKNKNRYVNIIPYDHSRVALSLQDNTPGSDYINASFIDGYNQPNAYIATQGPIPSTFPDFWRMMWELDCPTIVMVTNLKEDDKVKCNQYWPSYGTTTYGSLQVTLKEVENLAEYSIRTFNVSPLAGQSKVQMPVREVRQFHFLVWPDHGVPQFATALLSFRKRVIRYHPEKRGPMVVHCSAGVGRTGTFITIDVMLKQMEAENMTDIFNFVRHMRFRRNYMVQTSPQYIFLHDALLEAIMCGDTSIPAPELRKKLLTLMEVDSETKTTRMETQFETLKAASPADEDFDTTIAELPDNMAKNRFKHHLPSNDLRVVLSTENDQSDYICASFVDGYRQRIAFMVTQAPMTNTIGDFWRMIWEQKSAAIVMLTELEEGGQEMCVKYWPVEVGQPEVFGSYQVELSDGEREVGDYITRKFKLSPIDKPQESRIVTQFHYIRWPRSSAPTNTRSIIDLIDQLQRVQRKSGNGPITVHCDDGLGRTGAFCTLYTVLERVKTEQVVDIFQAVKTIRIQRTGLLETLAQYEYVHKAVLEFLDSFSDYQNFK